jgi:hypothetical protein
MDEWESVDVDRMGANGFDVVWRHCAQGWRGGLQLIPRLGDPGQAERVDVLQPIGG